MCVYWTTLEFELYGLYVCRESERILFYFFFSTLSVSTWECLSLDVVSLSVEHCCFLLVVDCMYLCTFKKNVSFFFCTNCSLDLVLLKLYSVMSSFIGVQCYILYSAMSSFIGVQRYILYSARSSFIGVQRYTSYSAMNSFIGVQS